MDIIPDFSNTELLISIFIIPLAVQWWNSWYPGAEPGGGGYIAQRMLAAKDENHAIKATFFFNILHYALRPWPWILVALASLVVFPMYLSNDQGVKYIVAAETTQLLQDSVQQSDFTMLFEGIEQSMDKANNETIKADLERLNTIVRDNSEKIEIKSLAYIFSKKNEGIDKDDWSNPLESEQLVSFQLAFPNTSIDKLGQDLGYPAMLNFLPPGLLGLVIASLVAAFMSTVSTQLNWGASYLVNDFYARFVKPDASEKELVMAGRVSTVILMSLSALFAFYMQNAKQVFDIILMFGAGTGLIFILRWFWWRINAWAEISAMIISGIVSIGFAFLGWYPEELPAWGQFPTVVLITTIVWVISMFATPAEDEATLRSFYKKIQPGGPGWQRIVDAAQRDGENIKEEGEKWNVPSGILAMILGCVFVYSALFATGNWLYGNFSTASILTIVSAAAAFLLFRMWGKIGKSVL
jgi:hypothetical protein